MAFKPLHCVFGKVTIPQRYVMVFMMQLALLNAYHLRVALNIAITVMIEGKSQNHTGGTDACPEYNYEPSKTVGKTYRWPEWIESVILYGFYIGYIFGHVPGGWLADKLGARHVMGTCMFSATIITLLFPLAIDKGGHIGAIILRVVLGVTHGPLLPAISTFIQCWVPHEERSFLGGIAFGGSNLGTVTGSIFTGIIIEKTNSWAVPFYAWGTCSLVWYIFYLFMVFSKPHTHPFASEEEKAFLEASIEKKKKFKVPWLEVSKSLPVWALFAGQFAHNFLLFTVLTDYPKYLKDILSMNVEADAVSTGFPFLGLWISNIASAYVSSFIENRNILSTLQARKLWTTISLIVPSCLLVVMVYIGCSRILASVLYSLALIFIGPFFSGMKVNVNDLTKHYGGTIMAVVNGLGSLAGILGPLIVGTLTTQKTREGWQLVFWIILAVSVVMAIFYCIFAKADRQEWDYLEEEDPPNQT